MSDQTLELAECKGLGHPDTLCDGIAERISHDYVKWCLEHVGGVLHHNFDKIMLVAGQSRVQFGHGELLAPIKILVGGRATRSHDNKPVPVDSIVFSGASDYLRETLKNLNPATDCVVECLVRDGEPNLARLAMSGLANDTISCCAVWPRSRLEETVYQTTRYINGELQRILPIGEDVKVSAYRLGQRIQLIVGVPFLAAQVKDIHSYEIAKTSVVEHLVRFASSIARCEVSVIVNAADNPACGRVYLTLTGTSAEMSDDGSVGRGNRASGLIAPFRPSTTPPAGKNPVSHPGKVYNVVTLQLAQKVVESFPEIKEARVSLFTTIGTPLMSPNVAAIAVRIDEAELSRSLMGNIRKTARSTLAEMELIIRGLLNEYPRLY